MLYIIGAVIMFLLALVLLQLQKVGKCTSCSQIFDAPSETKLA